MYEFKSINDIGNTSLKTYATRNKAEASFNSSWKYIDFDYEILEVTEKIEC